MPTFGKGFPRLLFVARRLPEHANVAVRWQALQQSRVSLTQFDSVRGVQNGTEQYKTQQYANGFGCRLARLHSSLVPIFV